MARYLTEFVGTFFLVLIVGVCVSGGVGALTPLAVFLVLSTMVYMGGPVSGAHYNPAVSVALLMEGALKKTDFLPYLAAQFSAAILASFAATHITGNGFVVAPAESASMVGAMLAEALMTFALVLVILNVAVAPRAAGNSYFGFAIGAIVGAGAFAVGGISGGAFNPAVGLGPVIPHLIMGGDFTTQWIYLVAPVLGGLLAIPVYRMQYPAEASG